MRLSIIIVLLIGAMGATEVLGDMEKLKEVVKFRLWFEETVKRLESGQTVLENEQFMDFAIDGADSLLGLLSYQTAVEGEEVRQETHDLEIDSKLIHRIQDVQNEVVPAENAHLKIVLEAIKQVLRGNFQLARGAIEESKRDLPDRICPLSERLITDLEAQNFQVVSIDHTEGEPSQPSSTIPTVFSQRTREQIGTIRNWIVFRLRSLFAHDADWVGWMMRGVPEIAYAMINSLPNQYVPSEESRFIGRVPVEEWGVVEGRIYRIETHITEMDQSNIDPIALIVIDVLQATRAILRKEWGQAINVMNISRWQRPCIESKDDINTFHTFMDITYRL
jgi:hypothetical protein